MFYKNLYNMHFCTCSLKAFLIFKPYVHFCAFTYFTWILKMYPKVILLCSFRLASHLWKWQLFLSIQRQIIFQFMHCRSSIAKFVCKRKKNQQMSKLYMARNCCHFMLWKCEANLQWILIRQCFISSFYHVMSQQ